MNMFARIATSLGLAGATATLTLTAAVGSPASTVTPDDDYWLHVSLTPSKVYPVYYQGIIYASPGTRAAAKTLLAHDPVWGSESTVFHFALASTKTARYTVFDVQTLPASQAPDAPAGTVLLTTPAPGGGGVRWVLMH